MGAYEQTRLWKQAFDSAHDAPEASDRLCVAYRLFWKNAVTLSREIQRDVPNLTLHDDTHFEALWSRADQIAGNLKLTPLEAFVLGGAILLHDSANSIAAFPGGLKTLRNTNEWKDATAEWARRTQGEDGDLASTATPEAQAAILFEVLRGLHAERARSLAEFEVSVEGRNIHLIEDDQLRIHLGDIIGLVAASHHWNTDVLTERLPTIQGALAGMPVSWTIRPVLLACLLRTADAAQLDQARAPDFLYALLQLQGLSEKHWRAQNRLATPVVSPSDPAALIFNSTRPFLAADAEAWWIAHDAIKIADTELQAANALLRDLRLPSLAINRIEGARSPTALSKHVIVHGWRPVQAEVKISQVNKVVEMFGGEQLYGDDSSVALRELIQNAADAIRFRRELEPFSSSYEGRITIRATSTEDDMNDVWLEVDDDGLGMSEAVLTGPLIDFGASYLSSVLVKSERPGLLSKGRSRIGKFGIGFFSAFMITDEVMVISRPFDAGREALRTLHFNNGLAHRPLLIDRPPIGASALVSTRVRLRLSAERYKSLLKFSQIGITYASEEALNLSLTQLIGALCPCLDVDVFVEDGKTRQLVHARRWMDEQRLSWLRRITLADARANDEFDEGLAESIQFLRFLDPTEPSRGLAGLYPVPGAGVATVGTLSSTRRYQRFAREYVGTIEHEPSDPRRSAGAIKAEHCIAAWASDQAKILATAPLGTLARCDVAEHVAAFGGDATPIARILLNRNEIGVQEIYKYMKEIGPVYAPVYR